ncbi:hypothetical protein SLS56_005022 [Neofusicoccum ribis]|uniref:C2H2-type domain-containing protein n=1 Tax=Neofusicoccum ribis TaxID=45134 RepID=A0ABR3SUU5_9PEZI
MLGVHTGTASNVASMAEEVDFEHGDPTHKTANPEFGWDVDNNPLMNLMEFDQTSGVEDVPAQSSGSNVGNGMTHDQYQTSPIPITETTAQPEHGCSMPGCTFTSTWKYGIVWHIRNAHLELRTCCQCQQIFQDTGALGRHASETGHASFACAMENCEKTFSRYDVLQRHVRTHRTNVQRFTCPHCRRHRGADGFKRKDHLTQHLRNYHHIGVDNFDQYLAHQRSCPHEGCPDWRPTKSGWGRRSHVTDRRGHAFNKSSDYIAHMRKVHSESDFPCTEPDCDRVGQKGYFRMRDLLKHKLKAHGIPIE